ncbi:MAG: rRNA maturation RNase YbeY [Pseudomonadota bacterium]
MSAEAALPDEGTDGRLTDLVIEAEGWPAAVPELAALTETAARAALEGAGIAAEGREIAVLFCHDSRIAELNAAFRDKAEPTNVLSWPAFALAPDSPGAVPPPPGPGPLGDLALALETTTREATDAQRPLKDHAFHLILHGCLHLLGYDHQTEADAALMEGIERRQLRAVNIPDPYQEGDAGPARR